MKKHKATLRIIIPLISIVFVFAGLGLGYAYWGRAALVSSFISTGRINTVFDSFELISETAPLQDIDANISDIRISEDGRSLLISIDNAYPGYSAEIDYSIKNEGDIPVYCKLITEKTAVASITVENPNEVVEPGGKTVSGTLRITISDKAAESSKSDLNVYLDYVQYNELH